MRSSFIGNKNNDNGKPRITILGFVIAVLFLLSMPLLTMISVNTLFGDVIGYDIKSYIAIAWMLLLVAMILRLANGQGN